MTLVDRPADVSLPHLLLRGKKLRAGVARAVQDARLRRAIDEPTTLTIIFRDPDRELIRNELFAQRHHVTFDDNVFEYAGYQKQGDALEVIYEDALVGRLRRKKGPRLFQAGTVTRRSAARTLATSVQGASFRGEQDKRILKRLVVGKKRSYWWALNQWAEDRRWRCFADQNTIWFGSDKWLMELRKPFVIHEDLPGIHSIDPTYDRGKRANRCDVVGNIRRWAARPGAPVNVRRLGQMANKGLWLVHSIERSIFSSSAEITLERRTPDLPEPKPEPVSHDERGVPGGGGGQAPGGSKAGWGWPAQGTVTSEFGAPRPGRTHKGIDIANVVGSPIWAARDGVVTFVGEASGYGRAIYVSHDGGRYQTRYAHLLGYLVSTGQRVSRGQRIATMDTTGNASGSHLHAEVRTGGVAINPRNVFP